MIRLHLVGFTTDLKNLVFGNERGATGGNYVVSIDARLRNTLEEVARMQEEAAADLEPLDAGAAEHGLKEEHKEQAGVSDKAEPEVAEEAREDLAAAAEAPAPPRRVRAFEDVHSKLTPKEIQALVRQGKSEEQVARLAQTDVAWVRRFTFPILAERAGVIEAVRAARLSKPRLGPSSLNIGQAVEEHLGARRLKMGPEQIDNSWKAVRKDGRWYVSFEFASRGKRRMARFSFDPETRQVDALNDVAIEIGYKPGSRARAGGARPPVSVTKPPSPVPAEGARQRPRPARSSAPPSSDPDGRARTPPPPKSPGSRSRGPAPR
jgi:hypothetical protein